MYEYICSVIEHIPHLKLEKSPRGCFRWCKKRAFGPHNALQYLCPAVISVCLLFLCLVSSNQHLRLCPFGLFFFLFGISCLNAGWVRHNNLIFKLLSSPKSHVHSSLRLRLPISFSLNNGLPARVAVTMTGRAQTLYCLLSSHTPGASRKSLSLRLLQAVLQWPWPECVWYYSQLNEGFTEATWIKRATATMYLV